MQCIEKRDEHSLKPDAEEGSWEIFLYMQSFHCYNFTFLIYISDTYKKYVANNTWHFYNGLSQSISDSMDVSETRIANIEVSSPQSE